MMNGRFLRNVLLKGVGLFLIFNFIWALLPIHPGQVSLYNVLWKGRERFPFGENPAESYNLSLYDVDAMFASLRLNGTPKAADEFRVFVIGDSSTWGTLLKPEETLAGQLDAMGLDLCGRQVRVYNLGYPTLSLTKDVMILQQAMQYQPDLIIWPLTLESFPRERQLESPIVANNLERVRSLVNQFNLNLDVPADTTPFWQRTFIGQRRTLADLTRLQFYAVPWSATGIDQTYPADYTRAAHDLEADDSFLSWPQHIPADALAFDVLSAGLKLAGQTPVLLINEPIMVSSGQNSDIRYNFYYPRWVYDEYRQLLSQEAQKKGWTYVDLWDLVPESEFTNSAIHLSPAGEALFTAEVAKALETSDCKIK
jgi:hypothetical protein